MSPGVELLTTEVKRCRGIRSSPMDTCPSPFHPGVRTVPVYNVGDTSQVEMKSYGLAELVRLAIAHPSPPSDGTGGTGGLRRGTKAIATTNLQIELPEFDPNNVPKCAEELSEYLLLASQQHADISMNCKLIKKSCKQQFLQRQVKTAIRKSTKWGNFLKRPEQMYPNYETDFSVRTEFRELPSLPEFPTAASISAFVAQLAELMGWMNPTSYGPTEPHLCFVGKIPPKTWENCTKTSESKTCTHSYDDLIDLLIELAMERENDSHMDNYVRKHLRRETFADSNLGGRSSQPHFNPGKGRGGQLKHLQQTPPSNGKGVPNSFYCRPTDILTTKVDLATSMTVMGEAFASSNCNVSRRLNMVGT